MKHTIEIVKLSDRSISYPVNRFRDTWDIKINGIEMKLTYTPCYLGGVGPYARFKFSSDVRKHPDYKEIRNQVGRLLLIAYQQIWGNNDPVKMTTD